MSEPQGALLVGSVNYDDAETTMRAAAGILGDRLKRIPDGEPGRRFHWIMFQPDVLGQAEGIERVGDPIPLRMLDARPLRVADGVDPASIRFPPLGYAEAAEESYAVFRRLRDEGVIPRVRFQVSLPTPLAVVGAYFPPEQRAAIEPVYRAAMYRELETILDAIPHGDLAIQWDNAVEFGIIEGIFHRVGYGAESWWGDDVWRGLTQRSADQASRVPEDVEVGFHLCYGDVAEKHFIEPTDAGNLVRYANMLTDAVERPITWIHLPVPIERDDDAYFAPLDELRLNPGTELYLGLVHREDGEEGARRRIAAALPHAPVFGVATECGIGRAPAGSTEGILRTHADVAAAW